MTLSSGSFAFRFSYGLTPTNLEQGNRAPVLRCLELDRQHYPVFARKCEVVEERRVAICAQLPKVAGL